MQLFQIILVVFLMFVANTVSAEQSRLLFILDGSGSMWGQMEDSTKIEVAKEVMTNLVQELPQDLHAGLEVYGHRKKADCNDIEILVPLETGDRQSLIEKIYSINPKGKTPITNAFQLAAEQLLSSEEAITIVLVSDGKDTCRGNPCTLINNLREQGSRIEVHVVGLGVNDEESEQLRCIAEAGGGRYVSANTTDQLYEALAEVQQQFISNQKRTLTARKKKIDIILSKRGQISVPNLHSRSIRVCENQPGELCISGGEGYVGTLEPEANTLEVPPGLYMLSFGAYNEENVEVKTEQATVILMGSLNIINLSSRKVNICESKPDSVCLSGGNGYAGTLTPQEKSLELPAGTYMLAFGGHNAENFEVKPGRVTKVILGGLSIPNLSSREVNVCVSKPGEICLSNGDGYAGTLLPNANYLELPVGNYMLTFGKYNAENIEVKARQTTEVLLGSISIPKLESSQVKVCEYKPGVLCSSVFGGYAGTIVSGKTSLELPPGTYMLKFEDRLVEGVEVGPGEDIVVEI